LVDLLSVKKMTLFVAFQVICSSSSMSLSCSIFPDYLMFLYQLRYTQRLWRLFMLMPLVSFSPM